MTLTEAHKIKLAAGRVEATIRWRALARQRVTTYLDWVKADAAGFAAYRDSRDFLGLHDPATQQLLAAWRETARAMPEVPADSQFAAAA